MVNRKILIIGLIAAAWGSGKAQEEAELLGDHPDGSRSKAVHLIELYDHEGRQIRATDKDPQPFSTRQTCGKCHSYETINQGWHFNGNNPDVPPGRPGQPWVLMDARARTQIPLSGRAWPGTFRPEQVGLTPWDFMAQFGMHFPGGSYGEMDAEDPEQMIRQNISGKYEINCLMCHHSDFRQDASETAMQMARQNYRWAAAGGSGKAIINGVALELSSFFDPEFDEGIKTTYRAGVFDKDNKVFFDLTDTPPSSRCYYCHSSHNTQVDESNLWSRDEDVHLTSGLACTDCHRNGLDHQIVRGDEDAHGTAATLSCKGCHLSPDEGEDESIPQYGRLGAPKPKHAGIPTIHFEKMNCTACHSGTWPDRQPGLWKTAQIHKLGLHDKHKREFRLPHIYAPVLLKDRDGKIGAHYVMWPAFWATLKNDMVTPIPPATVLAAAGTILQTDAELQGDWRPLSEEQVGQVLNVLKTPQSEGVAVYIAGGLLYRLNAQGAVQSESHPAAGAYAWPMAHDVRPSSQSMGVRGCADCHTTDSPFFFAGLPQDTPIQGDKQFVQMVNLQGLDWLYMWLFNAAFVFRPVLKVVAFTSCGLIGLVLLIYGLRALVVISRACAQEAE
ncbi:MAG: hypothetical protein GX298_02245 [Planctomycetes bacterium]|nr:hypothetical protein [Planctomycetota bacterium]